MQQTNELGSKHDWHVRLVTASEVIPIVAWMIVTCDCVCKLCTSRVKSAKFLLVRIGEEVERLQTNHHQLVSCHVTEGACVEDDLGQRVEVVPCPSGLHVRRLLQKDRVSVVARVWSRSRNRGNQFYLSLPKLIIWAPTLATQGCW